MMNKGWKCIKWGSDHILKLKVDEVSKKVLNKSLFMSGYFTIFLTYDAWCKLYNTVMNKQKLYQDLTPPRQLFCTYVVNIYNLYKIYQYYVIKPLSIERGK